MAGKGSNKGSGKGNPDKFVWKPGDIKITPPKGKGGRGGKKGG